jgi:hypothetical protein
MTDHLDAIHVRAAREYERLRELAEAPPPVPPEPVRLRQMRDRAYLRRRLEQRRSVTDQKETPNG